MKNIKFLLGLLTVVLVMASCATTGSVMDEDYTDDVRSRQIGNRVYVQDPFYGTVVLERDPFTGRYYDVTNGSRFGTGYYGGYPYGGGYYRGYRNRGTYGGGTIQQGPSREQVQQNREETRKKVLGN